MVGTAAAAAGAVVAGVDGAGGVGAGAAAGDGVGTTVTGVGATLTGFVVVTLDVVDDEAGDPDAVPALGVPAPVEAPAGAPALAPRLVGGASSFRRTCVWIASATPEALRL